MPGPLSPQGDDVSAHARELALAAVVIGIAIGLRVVHLGTPSLRWDELVHVRTAERPLADVLRIVRAGLTDASGNAGAMPADYVLLHAYFRTVPPPKPERLEAYFRTPACAASVAAVLALHFLGRSLFGGPTGALAALLLATSLPAILYAAEARAYSLFTLATILSVAAFAGVVRAPDRRWRWAVYLLTSAFYFLTGVFGLLVSALQYAILAVLALRGRGPRIGLVAASGVVLAAIVVPYLAGTPYDATYPRSAVVEPLAVTWASLDFFAAGSHALLWTFPIALPFALLAGFRRGRGAAAWAIVLAFVALPAIALVIRWKHYYFHGRHVLFLLPLFHLVVAAGMLELVRRLDPFRRIVGTPRARRALEAVLAGALVLAVVVPDLRAFVAAPSPYFMRSKTVRDHREVTRDIAAHVATLVPGTRHLVVAERDSPANAVLSAYLGWYRLTNRVTLRSPGVPLGEVERLLRAHGGDATFLELRPAVGLFLALRGLLGIRDPIAAPPPRVSEVTIVGYATPQQGADVRKYTNVTVRVGVPISP
jgi:hypothetical protein